MCTCASLWEALEHWAAETPSRTALRVGTRETSFADLAALARQRARLLSAKGVSRGDRVVIVGHNSLGWVTAYLAVMRLGAIVVPANNRLSAAQMAELCALLDARIVMADSHHVPLFAQVDLPILRLEDDDAVPGAVALPDLAPPELPALISFTSGTTGQPKGAMLSGAALCRASGVFRDYFRSTRSDSTVVIAPMFHNTGFVDQFGHMLLAGGETTLVPEFHRREAIEAFKGAPSTIVTAVPSVLRMLMMLDEADAVFATARTVLFGGSPMPAAWSREMLARWPHLRLVHGYGLTEFGSACSFLPASQVEAHGESVGFAAPGVELRLVGDDGEDVAPGAVGEVWVAGPTRMIEYWRRPDATAEKISGKWLRTGDLGRFDAEGRLFLDGRKDDVINRGGEKILPSHLESLLSERPDVASCVVVGVPDPVLQEVPVAAVEVRPGHVFDAAQARNFMATRLPGYAIPAHFHLFEPLPRIASGKVDRRQVRNAIIQALARPTPMLGDNHEA
jgi:long-chain acyl-CoA synthetase